MQRFAVQCILLPVLGCGVGYKGVPGSQHYVMSGTMLFLWDVGGVMRLLRGIPKCKSGEPYYRERISAGYSDQSEDSVVRIIAVMCSV